MNELFYTNITLIAQIVFGYIIVKTILDTHTIICDIIREAYDYYEALENNNSAKCKSK